MSGELRCAYCGFVERSWLNSSPSEWESMADHLDRCTPAIHYKAMQKAGLHNYLDEEISRNKKQKRYDELYMDIAERVSEMSYAVRARVGCVILFKDGTMSLGFNGMPSGMDNACEHLENDDTFIPTKILVTNPEVSHAEENAIAKIAKSHHSSNGATAYITLEPCMHCAKLLYSAGISRVVYAEEYRNHDGVVYLKNRGIEVEKL